MAPQFRQIIKPAQVSGLSITFPNGIRIGLDGMVIVKVCALGNKKMRHSQSEICKKFSCIFKQSNQIALKIYPQKK
jgi:hypothetical protein